MAMKALKKNVDELQRVNDKLQVPDLICFQSAHHKTFVSISSQADFVAVRRKVSELKSALLAHKDCPVQFDPHSKAPS